jgi:hypothetical protein
VAKKEMRLQSFMKLLHGVLSYLKSAPPVPLYPLPIRDYDCISLPKSDCISIVCLPIDVVATRLLTFRTRQFCTMALIQDTHVNMPFQSWELRPRDVNHAQLTIIAAVVEVEIQIKV